MIYQYAKTTTYVLISFILLVSISCKEKHASSENTTSPEEGTVNPSYQSNASDSWKSSYSAPGYTRELAELISADERIFYFYSDFGNIGKEMYLNRPENWNNLKTYREFRNELARELRRESPETKAFVNNILNDGLKKGTVMGSLGLQNGILGLAASLMELAEDGPEGFLPVVDFDLVVKSNIVENIGKLPPEAEIDFSEKPNNYGFYTFRERESDLTFAYKNDIFLITTKREKDAGKSNSDHLGKSPFYKDLIKSQNTLILTLPGDAKKLLNLGAKFAFAEAPNEIPMAGIKYLVEDFIEDFEKIIVRAEISDDKIKSSYSVFFNPKGNYGKLFTQNCPGEESNPPLRYVSPSGEPLIYAVGDICVNDLQAVIEEYMSEFIETLQEELDRSPLDFDEKSVGELLEEIDGRYAFAIEDVDSRGGVNLLSGFIGLKDGVIKENIETFIMPELFRGAVIESNFYRIDDLERELGRMFISIEDDGIYILAGQRSSAKELKRMINRGWKKVSSSSNDGYGFFDFAEFRKSIPQEDFLGEDEIFMEIIDNLEFTTNNNLGNGVAEVSATVNFDSNQTGFDGPILWQLIQLMDYYDAFDF